MKRNVFIIGGVIIVVVLVAIWVFLLFFNTSSPGDNIFSNFDFGDTTDTTFVPTETEEQPGAATNITSAAALQQLTTVPVLAYQEVQVTPSSTPEVRYVEAGTGHIFSINRASGNTTRLSATTIPSATAAALSPDGNSVIVQSGEGNAAKFIVGTLASSSDKLLTTSLDEQVTSFSINNSEVLYGVKIPGGYVGKSYSLRNGTKSTIFSLPFSEAAVVWGRTSASNHYVYPKASYELEGFLYRVSSGVMSRLPVDGFGLTAYGNETGLLFSEAIVRSSDRMYTSSLYTQSEIFTLPLSVIPEKCGVLSNNKFVCAAPNNLLVNQNLPDSWYSGEMNTKDTLWGITVEPFSMELLLDISNESGRDLDAVNIITNTEENRIYFQDRYSKILWVYNHVAEINN